MLRLKVSSSYLISTTAIYSITLLSFCLLLISLSQELGLTAPVVTKAPPKQSVSAEELKALLPAVLSSEVAQQTDQWKELKESGTVTAFGSASLRTFPVSLKMLEMRAGLTPDSLGLDESEVSLDDFKYATVAVTLGSGAAGIASLAFLPDNTGATLCYFFALLPILFLGLGSTVPGLIAGAIVSLKGSQDTSGASKEERVCRHEAAHFCCGYWCGLPVLGYSVVDGVARVEFGVSSKQFDKTELAALAVTALAGLVGEAQTWEKAVGANNDLEQLDLVFRNSADFMGSQAQQDMTRWGALTATSLLKENKAKYEQVVTAFGRQASVEECMAILES
jgi:hypothetical protein